MTRILDNCIVNKCGKCEMFYDCNDKIEAGTEKDYATIPNSCPLAECLIIPKDKIGFHSINGKLSSISIGINGENKDGNIDYIVIVKRGGHK